MKLEIKRLHKDLVADFYKVNCSKNGLEFCNCVAWWCPWNEFSQRSPEENRNHRELLFSQGEFDGYLLYADGEPLAWSQCGPRGRLKKLCDTYRLEENSETWAVTCFALAPSLRGKGIAAKFLQLMLEDLRTRGVSHLQGFPRRETEDPWTGPESIFKSAGFTLERDDPKIPIYGVKL